MINTTILESVDFPLPTSRSHDAVAPGDPHTDEVRRQLERILASKDFVASDRNRRFLRHVVENSLRGQTVRGYEIGTQVFGRPSSFNATADPIVRIEAGKLRRDLETYYLKSGRQDPLRIILPKGSYRAVFTSNEAAQTESGPSRGSLLILRAALLGLAGEGPEAAAAWHAIEREYPDFALDPQAYKALGALHGQDEGVRELLLNGLRRAAQARSHRNLAVGAMAGSAVA